LVNVKLLY